MTPQIIYEDKDLLVLNKPSGLITHIKNINDKQPSVVSWITDKHPNLKDIGEPFDASGDKIPRAGIVHRLDKETSGLLMVAKNEKAFAYFKNLFQDRNIKKYYQALVIGTPKKSKDTIKSPIGRIGLKRTTEIEGKKLIDKKEAETSYRTIKEYNGYTLIEVSPKTGRTHQIRVHMNSIGNPVAHDRVYGFKNHKDPPILDRLFLHAYKIEFTNLSGESLVLETDLPEELQKVLSMLE